LAGVEKQVIYGTFQIPGIDVCFRRREIADFDAHVLPVWMKLDCRNGSLYDQGNAFMDVGIVPSATSELQ
jgi:hypothetical protein